MYLTFLHIAPLSHFLLPTVSQSSIRPSLTFSHCCPSLTFNCPQWSIRPYLMDLGTTNGTFLNSERVEPLRYYELLAQDVVKFGQSTRDYVLLHEELASHK